ncbi:hypothetical protein [Acidianus bottle-shaped virus 3 strain ABV3]|uniref:Uncharacterized protein n=1 Tax=Acidianus bottle-shaped virus 3 strain ABV3 TaxID=1732174 RepID=A0A0N9P984_9VIRU|nr:hypothetical protein AVU00_gp22 [Acidianus bottle-shaped virus 3 strain ABV3]ALG96824.1 hypothetical protein [Acidianus bottle-shaped virus 3 strain ABV3]
MQMEIPIGNHKLSIIGNNLYLDNIKLDAGLLPQTDVKVFVENVKRNENKLVDQIEKMLRAKELVDNSHLEEKVEKLKDLIKSSPDLKLGDLVTYEVCTEVIPFDHGFTQFHTSDISLIINDRRNISCFVAKIGEVLNQLMNFDTIQIHENSNNIVIAFNGHDIITLEKPEFRIEKVLSFFNEMTKKTVSAVDRTALLMQIYVIFKSQEEYKYAKFHLENMLTEIADNSYTLENEYKIQD